MKENNDALYYKAANKSVEEIEEFLKLAELGARLYASRNLEENNEDNPLEIYAELDYNAVGLSSLEILHATSIFQSDDGSGMIWVKLEGNDDYTDFDEFDLHDQISICKAIATSYADIIRKVCKDAPCYFDEDEDGDCVYANCGGFDHAQIREVFLKYGEIYAEIYNGESWVCVSLENAPCLPYLADIMTKS